MVLALATLALACGVVAVWKFRPVTADAELKSDTMFEERATVTQP